MDFLLDSRRPCVGDIHAPSTQTCISAPEHYWQHDHEECVGAQIGGVSEVGVKGW